MLENPDMTQTDLYSSETVIKSGTDGGVVSPLLCFGFGQIYANDVKTSEDVSNIAMSRADAYRFCFGQALDENGNISSANTRMQTAYNVFGIDVVDTEKAPAIALEDSAFVGESAVFTLTADSIFTDGSDFADNISEVTLALPGGTEKVLTSEQYETGYRRMTADDGSRYYIGTLTLAEGVLDTIGDYQITVKASTYQDVRKHP